MSTNIIKAERDGCGGIRISLGHRPGCSTIGHDRFDFIGDVKEGIVFKGCKWGAGRTNEIDIEFQGHSFTLVLSQTASLPEIQH